MERQTETIEASDLSNQMEEERESGSESETEEGEQIPMHRWVMHGSVMFGREFCYAMETALVTPVLLQIGLPEQYYSLTWFLSPVLGFLFTPVIGSASDRCTLRWGRRRPFILALCVGVLFGLALFLNGSLIGLSLGDSPGSQPIGIVLTVTGVVLLDFCADASEGPIRAYLLDVADTEEQDLALNIHAFSAGLGGAAGYVLSGLDWTNTALGRAFQSQEQVLFLFGGIILILSVILHMLSLPERQFTTSNQLKATGSGESTTQLSFRPTYQSPPLLDMVAEEDDSCQDLTQENPIPDTGEGEVYFVDRVRSKSDTALALPDVTAELALDFNPDTQLFQPEVHHFLPDTPGDLVHDFTSSEHSVQLLCPPGRPPTLTDVAPVSPVLPKLKDETSRHHFTLHSSSGSHTVKQAANGPNAGMFSSAHCYPANGHVYTKPSALPRRHTFYRQPSFTFSYYGRVGFQRYRPRRNLPSGLQPLTTSQSLNNLSDLTWRAERRKPPLSTGSLSSEGSSIEALDRGTTVRLLWLSMFKMPSQLWRLCVCHLLTWFSIICEAVFYTDFMGQVVFHGDPTATANSTELQNYHRGVQMGCWGLVVCAATAAACSAILQKYLENFDLSIRVIYIVGTLGFSTGTAFMAIFPNVYVAMVMIASMGIIFMSISYCPYALLGQYHEINEYVQHSPGDSRRGFGIDCAILTCQVYISQILVASAVGAMVEAVGSVRVIPMVASGGSFLGFLTACFLVIYPEVESSSSVELGLEDSDRNGEND